MNEIGCIKVDVAMNDSAYYAHAPHESVTLPMAPGDLQNIIDKVTRFGSHGYEIKNIQTSGVIDKLHFAEDERVSLRAMNAMAECVKRNPDIDYDAVRDYCDNFDVPVDPLMVGNVIMQAGQMPYTSYSVDIDNEHPTPVDLPTGIRNYAYRPRFRGTRNLLGRQPASRWCQGEPRRSRRAACKRTCRGIGCQDGVRWRSLPYPQRHLRPQFRRRRLDEIRFG